jgi:hypothetical protein
MKGGNDANDALGLPGSLLLTHITGLVDADQLRPLINDVQSADTETALKAIKGLGKQ